MSREVEFDKLRELLKKKEEQLEVEKQLIYTSNSCLT